MKFREITRHWLNRKGSWRATKKRYMKLAGSKCRMCGYTKKIQTHHIIPRHVRPELTCELTNLINLLPICMYSLVITIIIPGWEVLLPMQMVHISSVAYLKVAIV